MQYLLMIYENEELKSGRSEADVEKIFEGYGAFNAEYRPTGKVLGGEALMPISTATTIRVREGKTLVTDGPFAETREQLGGFYLINAADLDEATAMAAKIPTAKTGSIEVRPIMEIKTDI